MGAKAFKGHKGWLAAEEGHLYVVEEKIEKCKFHVDQHDGGKKVSLRTHNGHYAAANSNHEVYMRHHHDSDEAKFALEQHSGHVALKSHHGGYLGVNAEGHVYLSPDFHANKEHFLWQEINW